MSTLISNLEVDEHPSKENLSGQPALLTYTVYLAFP